MKGRNCYARFCCSPGIEKLLGFVHVKSSFLKPVTSRPYQQEPFFPIAVAGFGFLLRLWLSVAMPATVFFYALHFLQFGRPVLMASLALSLYLACVFPLPGRPF